MMLTQQDMTCTQCNERAHTTLSLQVDRGGGLARFRVDCEKCGTFSHYLEHNELNRAVQRWLRAALPTTDLIIAIRRAQPK